MSFWSWRFVSLSLLRRPSIHFQKTTKKQNKNAELTGIQTSSTKPYFWEKEKKNVNIPYDWKSATTATLYQLNKVWQLPCEVQISWTFQSILELREAELWYTPRPRWKRSGDHWYLKRERISGKNCIEKIVSGLCLWTYERRLSNEVKHEASRKGSKSILELWKTKVCWKWYTPRQRWKRCENH